jgi:hypothetical protein
MNTEAKIELARNYFQEYLDKIYGIFLPGIKAGVNYNQQPDYYESEHRSAENVLNTTFESYQQKLSQLCIDEQREFISRIRRECQIAYQSDTWKKLKYQRYGTFFSNFGEVYEDQYREMAQNLSVFTAVEKHTTPATTLKLKWTGDAKILYNLIGQCLSPPNGKPLLDNTAEEIADFIKMHIDGIEANRKTIVTEISRQRTGSGTPPKRPLKLD